MKLVFGDCEIDLATVEIRRAGTLVEVQPQVFTVIEYLVRHRDRVVPKEELLDNVWGDRFVGDSALTTRIKTARKALGDDGQRQAVIKTVHGRGYRFVAEVAEGATTGPTGSDGVGGGVGAASPAAPAGQATSVAVTPGPGPAGPTELPEPDAEWPFVGRYRELDEVSRVYQQASNAGVAIRAGDRMGKSRFAIEAARSLATIGAPIHVVRGSASTRTIPLAALAALLPDDALRSAHQVEDLARAEIFRRASEALRAGLGHGEATPVVVVDDAPQLDAMSAAVLASALREGVVFGLVVHGSGDGDDDDPFDDLASTDLLHTLPLGPLTEVDLDVLLYRALGGPMDQVTIQQLDAASGRCPGLIRDIVEASRRSGSLLAKDGVWQLVGPVVSSRARAWPPPDLEPAALEAAERLALLGPVRLGVATTAADEAALEALDADGLLATTEVAGEGEPVVGLADPVLEATVREAIPPLRARRLKSDLAQTLLELDDPAAMARLVDWGSGFADTLEADRILGSAFAALLSDDLVAADQLAGSLDPAQHPTAGIVLGEVALKRNQWDRAEAVLSALDLDGTDPFLASLAIRRLASIRFTHHGEHEASVDRLAAEEADQDGAIARAIGARRMSLLTLSGRYREVLDEAPALEGGHGVTSLEVLISAAGAELGMGRVGAALDRCERAYRLLDEVVPAPWRAESRDAIASTECSAHLQAGDLERAGAVIRQHLPYGRRSPLGILPTKAAEVELEAGRPRAARTLILSTLDGSSRHEFPQFIGLADTLLSRVDLALGHRDAAASGTELAIESLASAPPVMGWRIATWAGELLSALDHPSRAIELLLAQADKAAGNGALEAEADLLCGAASADPEPRTAQDLIERIESLAADFEGDLWPIRIDHARARASDDQAALASVEARYRGLGFVRLADRAAAGC